MKNTTATIFAILTALAWTVLAFLVGDELDFDPLVSVLVIAGPVVLFFAIACIRNGSEFTGIWSTILAGMTVGMFATMNADGAWIAILCAVPLFIGGIIIHALLYKPELGTFGKLFDAARSWRPGGIMPTGESIMSKVKKAGNFGSDVQVAMLMIVVALNLVDIAVHLTV